MKSEAARSTPDFSKFQNSFKITKLRNLKNVAQIKTKLNTSGVVQSVVKSYLS